MKNTAVKSYVTTLIFLGLVYRNDRRTNITLYLPQSDSNIQEKLIFILQISRKAATTARMAIFIIPCCCTGRAKSGRNSLGT